MLVIAKEYSPLRLFLFLFLAALLSQIDLLVTLFLVCFFLLGLVRKERPRIIYSLSGLGVVLLLSSQLEVLMALFLDRGQSFMGFYQFSSPDLHQDPSLIFSVAFIVLLNILGFRLKRIEEFLLPLLMALFIQGAVPILAIFVVLNISKFDLSMKRMGLIGPFIVLAFILRATFAPEILANEDRLAGVRSELLKGEVLFSNSEYFSSLERAGVRQFVDSSSLCRFEETGSGESRGQIHSSISFLEQGFEKDIKQNNIKQMLLPANSSLLTFMKEIHNWKEVWQGKAWKEKRLGRELDLSPRLIVLPSDLELSLSE